MARRRVRLVRLAGMRWKLCTLYLAQLCHGVAYTPGELFNGFDPAARRRTQLFTKEQLRLTDHACQRIINLVSHVRDQLRHLAQLRYQLSDDRA